MFLNIAFLGIVLYKYWSVNIPENLQLIVIALILGLFILNYFHFIYKKKYIGLSLGFGQESKYKRKMKGWIAVLYVIITWGLVLAAPFIK